MLAWALVSIGCIQSQEEKPLPPKISIDGTHTSIERTQNYTDTLRMASRKPDVVIVLSESPGGAVLKDSIVTWRADSEGDFKFTATATDNGTGLQFVCAWTVHVALENFAPVILVEPKDMIGFGVAGGAYLDTVKAGDVNHDRIAFRLLGSYPWIAISDSILSFRPAAGDTGTHAMMLVAEDGRGGKDTLAWSLHISLEDKYVCGFRNLEKGTSWEYQVPVAPFTREHTRRLRVADVVKRGDSTFYSISDTAVYADAGPYDHSFMLLGINGVVKAWTGSSGGYIDPIFDTDCVKEYRVATASVLGQTRKVYAEVAATDTAGRPKYQDIRVQGIGLVHSLAQARNGTSCCFEIRSDLIGFNGRKVKITSTDPLVIVYE